MLDEHLPVVLELFSDILIDPVFDPVEIDRERKVILEEIKMVEDTPADLVHEVFLENFWPGHPLGRPILGSVDTVNSFNQELLRDCFESNYVPPNMVIAAAGNLDHDDIVREIRKYFQLQRSGDSFSTEMHPPNPKSLVLLRPKVDLEQAHICLGTMAYSARSESRYAAGILNVILGGSMSSRLFQKIREERGLCYTVYSSMNPFDETGYLTIYAGTSPESVHTAIELILQECRSLVTKAVSAEELENAKNHLKGSLMLSLESSSSRMFSLAKNDMTYGRQILADEVLERIGNVTLEDVQHVAMELFQHSDYGIVVVGDLEDLNVKIDEFQTH
jgi:predicted Zn-dependent peptidase